MKLRHILLLALAVTGCDKLTGAAEQKTLDAEATGYACRVSSKAPADCISENDKYSPTSLLVGWKAADADILARVLDPSMGTKPEMAAHPRPASAPAAEEAAAKKADVPSEDTAEPAPEKTKH
jgi:hypothetical protein